MPTPQDLSVATYNIHKGIGTDRKRDLGRTAVPLDDVGDAHGWHGNLLLVRGALVHEVHQLILPGWNRAGPWSPIWSLPGSRCAW